MLCEPSSEQEAFEGLGARKAIEALSCSEEVQAMLARDYSYVEVLKYIQTRESLPVSESSMLKYLRKYNKFFVIPIDEIAEELQKEATLAPQKEATTAIEPEVVAGQPQAMAPTAPTIVDMFRGIPEVQIMEDAIQLQRERIARLTETEKKLHGFGLPSIQNELKQLSMMVYGIVAMKQSLGQYYRAATKYDHNIRQATIQATINTQIQSKPEEEKKKLIALAEKLERLRLGAAS